MAFTEMSHAFIAASFYVHLTGTFGSRGRDAFMLATRYYAEQRGRRMAQRAIRDGVPLTPAAYARYGEWTSSAECLREGTSNQADVLAWEPDLVTRITRCPWHEQFRKMGLEETAGAAYCQDLDRSIMRGFNPAIIYEVDQTLETSDCCLHRIRAVDYGASSMPAKDPAAIRGWDYHCSHSLAAYRQMTESIFGGPGQAVTAAVLSDFEKAYGKLMLDQLVAGAQRSFETIDN